MVTADRVTMDTSFSEYCWWLASPAPPGDQPLGRSPRDKFNIDESHEVPFNNSTTVTGFNDKIEGMLGLSKKAFMERTATTSL